MADVEREMYELKKQQAHNTTIVIIVIAILLGISGVWLGLQFLENQRRSFPTTMTVEKCRDACGSSGVHEFNADEDSCTCNKPPDPPQPQRVGPLRCTCE